MPRAADSPPEPVAVRERPVVRLDECGAARPERDRLAVEAPLAIRLAGAPFATTMRTPGHDAELVAGFLVGEGAIASRDELRRLEVDADTADVEIATPAGFAVADRARRVTTSSACGACSRPTIDVLADVPAVGDASMRLPGAVLHALPGALRSAQAAFAATGGTHAAGLFDDAGRLLLVREDVGRHNAVDKVVGRLLLDGALPARGRVLMVSGRASYEIVQKAAGAGIAIVVAVSAASDLAADVAERAGITLVAFARGGAAVVMSRPDRIAP